MADRKARYERRQQARGRQRRESRLARLRNLRRIILTVSAALAAVAVVVTGIIFYASTRKELPPTSFGPAHSESLPTRQINNDPIPRPIQEHVMERGGVHRKGGMLVQYNCAGYQCEPDLVERLTEIARSYPPQVYLAPYPGMDAKIALAAPGRLLTLETLDEDRIREFIERNLDR
ncbi:MAG: DUF3105 domain-containing protein [Dehalococcoidia bacterium]